MTQSQRSKTSREEAYFDAVLHPYRSLSPRGFGILMLAVAAVSFTAGLAFLLMGAWPVFGFFGLDVLLIYLAFRLNYRSGRAYERIVLPRQGDLTVERHAPNGERTRWAFEPAWVRVSMAEPPTRETPLVLSSHGREIAVGSFLLPEERLDVARALSHALGRWRDELAARGGGDSLST